MGVGRSLLLPLDLIARHFTSGSACSLDLEIQGPLEAKSPSQTPTDCTAESHAAQSLHGAEKNLVKPQVLASSCCAVFGLICCLAISREEFDTYPKYTGAVAGHD